MMKKVLLVGIYDTNTVSLAPHILRAYVEQFDLSRQFKINTREFSIFSDSSQHIAEELNKEKPDIVGFSVYVWNIKEILEIIKRLHAVVILGGPQVTDIEEELIRENPKIDFIVTGEGERSFKEFLEYCCGQKTVEQIRGITTRNIKTAPGSPIELDSIPSPYETIFRDYHGITWISFETSRGCPMKCRFCTWAYEKKMRYFSVDRVKRELDIILKQPHIKHIYFCDSNLLLNKRRAKEIIEYIIDARSDISIRYEFSVEQLEKEIIDLLVELPNHEFNFGIQSVNIDALRDMGRSFNRETFARNYGRLIEKNQHANNITVDLIYGLPGDNIEGYKESLDYVLSLKGVRRILTNPLIVLPGSEFYKSMDKYKITLRDNKSYIIRSNYTFSEHDINSARKYSFFVSVIYFNYLFRDCIKLLAEKWNKRYIDMVILFMESVPFDMGCSDDYPDMVPSERDGFDQRNAAIARVIVKYADIISHFKDFSRHEYDVLLEGYEGHFSDHFHKLKSILGTRC